jgi:hypothetical protein
MIYLVILATKARPNSGLPGIDNVLSDKTPCSEIHWKRLQGHHSPRAFPAALCHGSPTSSLDDKISCRRYKTNVVPDLCFKLCYIYESEA